MFKLFGVRSIIHVSKKLEIERIVEEKVRDLEREKKRKQLYARTEGTVLYKGDTYEYECPASFLYLKAYIKVGKKYKKINVKSVYLNGGVSPIREFLDNVTEIK